MTDYKKHKTVLDKGGDHPPTDMSDIEMTHQAPYDDVDADKHDINFDKGEEI